MDMIWHHDIAVELKRKSGLGQRKVVDNQVFGPVGTQKSEAPMSGERQKADVTPRLKPLSLDPFWHDMMLTATKPGLQLICGNMKNGGEQVARLSHWSGLI